MPKPATFLSPVSLQSKAERMVSKNDGYDDALEFVRGSILGLPSIW